MKRIYLLITSVICTVLTLSSCSDFFDEDSTYVINADENHLTNATDTIYSVTGILNKLQAIADRTILLGEARGDLMDVTAATSSDLRDVANFNIADNNQYNVPRDYYAIINNCNYFIAHADTAMKNNRNENIFKAEYAAVKAIRAWTYLQLVINYGKVPFVTTPILTKEQADQEYPSKDIQGICNYFINEDGLKELVDQEYPNYGDIKSLPSPKFFIPMRLVLGDLCLWAGQYLDAARYYYGYIENKNGMNTSYPTTVTQIRWYYGNSNYTGFTYWDFFEDQESNTSDAEFITYIPTDSIPSEPHYSQLRNIFNTTADNDYKASLVPSAYLKKLSAAQSFCHYDQNANRYVIAPKGLLIEHSDGDMRLFWNWGQYDNDNFVNANGDRYTRQYITKYSTRNVRLYRRMLVYLRLAEALNCAGYPHFAYQILSSGVNRSVITDYIAPYYSEDKAQMLLSTFTFPDARYVLFTPEQSGTILGSNANTLGIHSRGSGFTPMNPDYQMPVNPDLAGEDLLRWQQRQVEDMIMDEEALEFAFEGYRFYDLMRVALRRGDPSYLADKVYNRKGADNEVVVRGMLPDLTNTENWYLKWNGQIGLDIK